MRVLPSDNSYRTFCDLTTGYRMFRIISAAVESGIIDLVDDGARSVEEIVRTTALKPEEGRRFITLLVHIGLLEEYAGTLCLSRFSRSYLSRTSPTNQRQVLKFEPVLMENWDRLGQVLQEGQGALIQELAPVVLEERLHLFQQAMAEAASVRSRELWDALDNRLPERGVIIDIGAGDCTYLRGFLQRYPQWHAVACDLPDVCRMMASRGLPEGVTLYPCNIIDQQEMAGLVERYHGNADLLLFSNICHCYNRDENQLLLRQAGELLTGDGLLLVHDFFRDANSQGALYDLHMLVNTLDGRCYSIAEIDALLRDAGFPQQARFELPSGSLALLATRTILYQTAGAFHDLKRHAQTHGFFAAVELEPAGIHSEAWVRAKCAYGCPEYGRRWSCPPHSMDQAGFAELLSGYSRALLVAGQPPLRDFQHHLLELEKEAFLTGFKKALVFSGGPCCWCETCPPDRCTYPEKRRPSLESCGCDVFALAERCDIPVTPLRQSDDFVQYIGLLLVD